MSSPTRPTIDQSRPELAVLFSRGIVILMTISITLGLVQVIQRFIPTWKIGYFLWISFFVSLEAISTRRITQDLEDQQRVLYQVSKWLAFALMIKILTYLNAGYAKLLSDIESWQADFLSFFSPEYFLALGLALFSWFLSFAFIQDIDQLFDRDSQAGWDDLGKVQNALNIIRGRLASRVFFIGALVVTFAILARINAADILSQVRSQSVDYAPVINVLFFILLSMSLLSLTQYAMMRTQWQWRKLPEDPKIPRNWIKYSLAFFVFLAVLVFFLPTDYSLGLFDTLRVLIDLFVQAAGFIIMLIFLPVTFCLSLLRSTTFDNSPLPLPQPSQQPLPDQIATPGWWGVVRSLFFWATFLFILFMIINYYLRQNQALFASFRSLPVFQWISRAMKDFWDWLVKVKNQASQFVAENLPNLYLSGKMNFRSINPASLFSIKTLSAREKVIHYYISLLKISEEHGVKRKVSQTPYQFEKELDDVIPDLRSDFSQMTGHFIEARYSQHPIEEPEVRQTETLWERIKNFMSHINFHNKDDLR